MQYFIICNNSCLSTIWIFVVGRLWFARCVMCEPGDVEDSSMAGTFK